MESLSESGDRLEVDYLVTFPFFRQLSFFNIEQGGETATLLCAGGGVPRYWAEGGFGNSLSSFFEIRQLKVVFGWRGAAVFGLLRSAAPPLFLGLREFMNLGLTPDWYFVAMRSL